MIRVVVVIEVPGGVDAGPLIGDIYKFLSSLPDKFRRYVKIEVR